MTTHVPLSLPGKFEIAVYSTGQYSGWGSNDEG
jgi:hypothetical protein